MESTLSNTKQSCCVSLVSSVKNNFLFLLAYLIAFFQGLVGLTQLATNYIMKDYLHFTPAKSSSANSLLYIPWMIKPVFGLISDSFPIYGNKRKPYLFITSILIIIMYVFVYLWCDTAWVIILSLVIGSGCLSFMSVIGEALTVELSNDQGHEVASKNVSNFFLIRYIGNLFSALGSGYLLEVVRPETVFLIGSGMPLVIAFTCLCLNEKAMIKKLRGIDDKQEKICDIQMNQIQEKNIKNESSEKVKEKEFKIDENQFENNENRKIEFELGNNNVSNNEKEKKFDKENLNIEELINDKENNMNKKLNTENDIPQEIKDNNSDKELKDNSVNQNKNELDVKSQLTLLWSFIKQKHIYRPILFILIFSSTPSTGDAFFYFYTTKLKFSQVMMGRLNFLSVVANIVGIYLYKKWLYKYTFKSIMIGSTFVWMFFSMLSLIVIFRVNLKMGIPDFLFCMTADSLTTAIAEINTMPILVLAANMCPKNIEGTTYALIMSVTNFGYFVSYQLGSVTNSVFGITSKNFDNLWIVVLMTNIIAVIPIFILFFINVENVPKKDDQTIVAKENI